MILAMSAESLNTLLNSLTALFIAAGGLGLGKLITRSSGKMTDKTDESTEKIVEQLASLNRNVRGLHGKVNGLNERVKRIEEGAENG